MAERNDSRNKRQYNAMEMSKINTFKKDYLEADSAATRKHVFESMIAPALFAYWVQTGNPVTGADATGKAIRTQDLLAFIRNNWRVRIDKPHAAGYKVKRSDVLWWTRQPEVFAEIAALLGLPHADSSTNGWFSMRLRACKNIVDKMSASQLSALDAQVEVMKTKGIPEHIQNQLAKKKWGKRFNSATRDNYQELGVLSLSFVVFNSPSGQLSIDIHDEMANLLGINAQSFESKFQDKTIELKRLIIDHVKSLRALLNPTTATPDAVRDTMTIHLSDDGFPLVPMPWDSEKYTKKQLEDLFRGYLGQHYFLATRRRTAHVPFTDMQHNIGTYVRKECIPKGFQVSKPRDLKKEDISRFFDHVGGRQMDPSIGPANAFRFHAVKKHRKGNEIVAANYHSDSEPAEEQACAVPVGRSKSKATPDAAMPAKHLTAASIAQQGMQSVWSIHDGEQPGNFIVNKDSTPATPAVPSTSEFVVLSHADMVSLRVSGHSSLVPINGPNDGPPRYHIPRDVYMTIIQNLTQNADAGQTNNESHIMPPINAGSRKTADTLAIAEANRFQVEGKLRKRKGKK